MAGDKPDDASKHVSIGPIGPLRIVEEDDQRLKSARAAFRIAQAAITRDELADLVLNHADPIVRMEAVPRLKARFPQDESAHNTLMRALTDSDDGVRCAAISAVADLALPGAADRLAAALLDTEPDVRLFAAIGLQKLGDARAPEDPESFAYRARA